MFTILELRMFAIFELRVFAIYELWMFAIFQSQKFAIFELWMFAIFELRMFAIFKYYFRCMLAHLRFHDYFGSMWTHLTLIHIDSTSSLCQLWRTLAHIGVHWRTLVHLLITMLAFWRTLSLLCDFNIYECTSWFHTCTCTSYHFPMAL